MGKVYRQHFRFVWALLRRLGVHDADLEDVAQDVFVVVHRRLPQFEGRASIKTWLYAITVRVVANHKRRRRRAPAAGDSFARGLVAPASTDPEDHTARSEASVLLDRLLDRLDDKKRAVFVLAEVEGLSAPEIARIVGTNPRTVYSRLRAARERFERELAHVHARERGDLVHAGWLAEAAEHPPARAAQRRVWAALALKIPTLAPAAWVTAVKASTLSVGLGAAALGAVAVVASPSPARSKDAPQPVAVQPVRVADAPRAAPIESEPSLPDPAPDPAPLAEATAPPAARDTPPIQRARVRAPKAPANPLDEELAVLGQARRALAAGDALTALRRARAHARQFPDSHLRREGARSEVAALCALGRVAEARSTADAASVPRGCSEP